MHYRTSQLSNTICSTKSVVHPRDCSVDGELQTKPDEYPNLRGKLEPIFRKGSHQQTDFILLTLSLG